VLLRSPPPATLQYKYQLEGVHPTDHSKRNTARDKRTNGGTGLFFREAKGSRLGHN